MESALKGNGVRVNGREYEIVGVTGGDSYMGGGPTVFDSFDTTPFTYLVIDRGSTRGNRIEMEYECDGIFKLRGGVISDGKSENEERGATLHMRPTEPFLDIVPSNREHYRLTLNPTKFLLAEAS